MKVIEQAIRGGERLKSLHCPSCGIDLNFILKIESGETKRNYTCSRCKITIVMPHTVRYMG